LRVSARPSQDACADSEAGIESVVAWIDRLVRQRPPGADHQRFVGIVIAMYFDDNMAA
jgi:hypothetical protein